jgi:hypothetical protein
MPITKTFLCFSSSQFKNGEEDLSRAKESMKKTGGMLIKCNILTVVLKHLFYFIYAPTKACIGPVLNSIIWLNRWQQHTACQKQYVSVVPSSRMEAKTIA